MNQQIDINRILQILGAKEVEIDILRERIRQLEQEKQKESKPLKSDPVE
ncbi:MAG: hypothetical protein RBR45_14115 [Pseudomonas sp.]|nr:hypothetical protein [Pseudomonas sp.]